MLTRILQECTHITLRPRHINSLNNVLTGVIALEHPEEQLEALAVVIRTISNLKLKM